MKKVFLFMFFAICTAQAQISTNYKETPLEQVLKEISESYNLIFSFSNATVQNKIITLATNNVTLDEILTSLKNLTNLEFKKISDRQIIVKAPDNKVEVCGYLFDNTTQSSLPYASIFIADTSIGTIANEDGFFQLGHLDIGTTVTIQYVGYKEKTMTVASFKDSRCPKIGLTVESTALEEVLIVEYITKGIDKSIDGSLDITNERLGILPGQTDPDVLQSIQLVPGINSLDESATGIQIRGGSPDQNLILWDDIKMYNSGHFFGMISAFNPNVISDTKIFKGGADPQYGDRVSGVIDISSDKEVPEKFSGGIGINGTHSDVFIKAPIGKKVGLVVSGRRSYADIVEETPTYNAYFDKVFQNTKIVEEPTTNGGGEGDEDEDEDEIEEDIRESNFFFYDTNMKVIINPTENDKILISGLYTNNDLNFEIINEEDIQTDDLEIMNAGSSFVWEGTKLNRITHQLKAYYSEFDSDYQFVETQNTIIEEQSIRKNTVEDIGVDFSISYEINKKNIALLGYQFSNNEVFYNITRESEFENPINEADLVKNSANTLYGNYKFSPIPKSFINLGVRVSHYSIVDQFYIEPRLNIEYPVTKYLRLKATGEHRFQPMSQLVEFEDTQLRIENNLWIHANDEIPLLDSYQYSGGFLFSMDGWNLEVDGYYKTIDGLTSLTNGFNNINTDLSTGESEIFGVDVLLKKRFHNFRTWIGYTYNDIQYTFPEIQQASFSGNNDIAHNFRFSNTYETENWEFSLGWTWRSGAPFTDADLVNDEIVFGTPNAERLEAYHRLDASLIYRFDFNKNGKWRGQLGASILNIYNRIIPISISYQADDNPTTGNVELDILRQESLGITPNLVFRMYF
ncbi:carboxypeptidase-like regulatory domain-containing protein [Aquimarina sp. 2201CG5-10]|uniref:carboxypeptidase-like regulatory domain-containing protein n=1 Tax=Aquimarina callyspongiae TaxID=3098150 RepID=UPI002AB47BAE|nr:carboxypeptidase-like regulatory domain-containing protein [Aquimarina sp. 2201CG5-10]MDY8137199.1 carboxypeptidase-like regulatory domain-containing protein [Aquimarina sp. 2201CG5-10]